jgi:hypothetical protein
VPERKIVEILTVRQLANDLLRTTPGEQAAQREGVVWLLEAILNNTGTYHGYGEFQIDGKNTEDFGLRRQYYGPPSEGVTLIARTI